MPIMSRRKNLNGSRGQKLRIKPVRKTARQLFLDSIMNLPDDEKERKRKEST